MKKIAIKKLKYFIQVNIGNELQKSGIPIDQVDSFYNYCTKENNLNILGLMTLPPNDQKPSKYFKVLNEIKSSLELNDLSMGMSSDYEEAVNFNSTF